MEQLTFLSEEPLASRLASPGLEADWVMTVVTWHSNISALLIANAPDGWYGRTSPVSCHRTEDGILVPSSEAWLNAGMGSPTECLTLNISECHSAAAGSLLSDVLEAGPVPQRFFLSAKASQGIIRRSAKRPNGLAAYFLHSQENAAKVTGKKKDIFFQKMAGLD